MTNWKTNLAAIALAISAVATGVSYMVDSDPNTKPNWELIITQVSAAAGLFMAKDHTSA